jgi:hypothetical protein
VDLNFLQTSRKLIEEIQIQRPQLNCKIASIPYDSEVRIPRFRPTLANFGIGILGVAPFRRVG